MPTLDGSAVFRSAVLGGQQLFLDDPHDTHFNAAGHALWASWLHEQLEAYEPDPQDALDSHFICDDKAA